MDPLSITSSIQTICETVGGVIRVGKRLYHAPAELDMLLNEIADINLLVCNVEEMLRAGGGSDRDGGHGSLVVTLSRIKDLSLELETLVESELTKPSGSRVNRVAFLNARKKLERIKIALQSLRKELREGVGEFHVSRISVEIRDIASNVLATKAAQAEISHESSATARDMAVVLRQLENQEMRHGTVEMLLSEIKELLMSESGSPSSLGTAVRHSSPRLSNSHEIAGLDHHVDDCIMIRTQYRPGNSCRGNCMCVCHSKNQLRTPGPLSHLVGSLFIGYTGLPRALARCSIKSCERQRKSTFYVTYQFPTWWVRRRLASMLFITIQNSSLTGTHISVRYPRVIDDGSTVFELASQADIPGLARLFDSGWATPLDVERSSGRNVMNIATTDAHHNLSALMFLLRQGADPYLKDNTGICAAHNLLALVLTNGRNMFGHFLDVDATADDFCFPELHKSLLGLINTPLEEILQKLPQTTATVDDVDAFQRTALANAVWRNDLTATKLLLQYGADPNLGDLNRITPLHYTASNADTPDCAVALLFAGADLHATCLNQYTPLMLACRNPNDPQGTIARLLVKSTDKSIVSGSGHSAVHFASSLNGSLGALKVLIEMGHDINALTNDLDTPLMHAIRFNNTAAIKMLLSHGAIHTNYNKLGYNLLHFVAQYANFESIQAIKNALLSPINVHVKNKFNQTPLCIALLDLQDAKGKSAIDLLLSDHENRQFSDQRGTIRLALQNHSFANLEELLAQPDAYILYGYHGTSFTQYIGSSGDILLFSILKSAAVSKINMQAKDLSGKTARDWLLERMPRPSPDVVEAFDELCESIKQNTLLELSLPVPPVSLQWAIIYNDHECLRRWLTPSAILRIRKLAGTSVFQFAASFADEETMEILSSIPWPDDDLYSELLPLTIDINGQEVDSIGYTARSWFEVRNPAPSLKLKTLFDNLDRRLQQRQRALRYSGSDGSALEWALISKDHEFAKAHLLGHPLDRNTLNEAPLILHMLAFNGDYKTISLVQSHLGTGIDVSYKDHRGRTALDVLNARSKPAGPASRKAFMALLAEAEENNRGSPKIQVASSFDSKRVTGTFLSIKFFGWFIIVVLLTLLLYFNKKSISSLL